MPASEKEPYAWGATVEFTLVLEKAGLNAIELSAYRSDRGLFLE